MALQHSTGSLHQTHGNLAGGIALHQLNYGRHFIVENPHTSELFELPAWTQVERHPHLVWTCMCRWS
eukprot:1129537-Prorocentrum_lima.AAC.1